VVLFRMLGPLEVQTERGWTWVRAPKWRTVLAVLLLNPGQVVSTDRLIAEVWPGKPPRTATNLVSVYVHRLRGLIGEAEGQILVTRAPGYQIMIAPEDLDTQRFAALTAEARNQLSGGDAHRAAELLSQALTLWRGSALADVPPSALISVEAGRLEESRVEAQVLKMEADLGCGEHVRVVPEARRLLADHSIREELWTLLLRALQGSGRQAEALEAYGQAREVIAEELGVDPGAELQRLYQQILAAGAGHEPPDARPQGATESPGGPTSAPNPASPARATPVLAAAQPLPQLAQLPADIPDFTGRAEHVQDLRDLLAGPRRPDSPGAVVVAAVIGAGGLGKTTLAVHTAHLLRKEFPDGQLYINLLGTNQHPPPPSDVLARFLRDLGMNPARIPVSEDERSAQYRSRLTDRRVLIVLDDARDAAQVRPLLPGSASCAVLVTTRSRMPDLAGSRFVDLDVLAPAEARTLFAGIVGADRAEAEPEATEEVLTACAGLPLALRIAGARLASRGGWNVRTLARRVSDERGRLDELQVGNLAVRACFEVSFASLPGSSQPGGVDPARAFRLFGLWAGPSIGLPAAAALLGQPESAAADALEVLVDAHLLDSPEPDAYRFHDLLRVYAADRARAQETEQDRMDAITRLLTWYLHTVEAAARVISPQHTRVPLDPVPAEVRPLDFTALDGALNWCEAERARLVAAVRLAADAGLHEIAWKLAAAAMSFLYRRSHWTNWVVTHQIGLASARQVGDRLAEAWMLNNLGMAYGQQRMEESVSCFEQALALYREVGDAQGEARAATNVAYAYFVLSRFSEALAAGQRSLGIQRQFGKRYGEGITLDNLGCTYRELAQFDEAIDCLRQALAIFRELGDRDAEAESLSDLGVAYLGHGGMNQAIASLREALAIRRDIGDRHGQARTLQRLGLTQQRAGHPGEARELLSEALDLLEELGDHAQSAQVRASLVTFTEAAG
jgi:DNA-binding SARP family transcriptional activator/tetratricopeptide (TPR) repeat protein